MAALIPHREMQQPYDISERGTLMGEKALNALTAFAKLAPLLPELETTYKDSHSHPE